MRGGKSRIENLKGTVVKFDKNTTQGVILLENGRSVPFALRDFGLSKRHVALKMVVDCQVCGDGDNLVSFRPASIG